MVYVFFPREFLFLQQSVQKTRSTDIETSFALSLTFSILFFLRRPSNASGIGSSLQETKQQQQKIASARKSVSGFLNTESHEGIAYYKQRRLVFFCSFFLFHAFIIFIAFRYPQTGSVSFLAAIHHDGSVADKSLNERALASKLLKAVYQATFKTFFSVKVARLFPPTLK